VLTWLLGEPRGEVVREALAGAQLVLSSELTLLECDRALVRAVATERIHEAAAADRHAFLMAAAAHWHILRLDTGMVDRARRPFPAEPIRTLDALHLASALVARTAVPGLALLSLDERLRASAQGLGFTVIPG
jgi:predicted nucleic acid-binding protein